MINKCMILGIVCHLDFHNSFLKFSVDIGAVQIITVLMNTLFASSAHHFEAPKHQPWLERLLDRAHGLQGRRRFWFGVWV